MSTRSTEFWRNYNAAAKSETDSRSRFSTHTNRSNFTAAGSSRSTRENPSLAVRLMQVAGEYEVERKQEVQRLQSEIDTYKTKNETLERKKWSAEQQVESLSRKLAQATIDIEKAATQRDSKSDAFEREVIALRFALANSEAQRLSLESRISASQSSSTSSIDALTFPSVDEQEQVAMAAARRAIDALRDAVKHEDKVGIAAATMSPHLYGRYALALALEQGLDAICEQILRPRPQMCINNSSEVGRNRQSFDDKLQRAIDDALLAAARTGNLSAAKRVLEMGASATSVAERDLLGHTPMLLACLHGHVNIIKLLLSKDDVDAWSVDTLKNSGLHLAARSGRSSAVKVLLLQGCDPHVKNEEGISAVQYAETFAANDANRDNVLLQFQDKDLLFWNASVRANRLYNQKQFEAAAEAYSVAIEHAPRCASKPSPRDLATLHYNRARASYRLAQHCIAIEDCDKALDHDSQYRNALAQRAECYMALFEFDRAVKDFDSLLETDPSDHQWERRKHDAQVMRDISHYAVLSVGRNASSSQLKKAFRQQCLRWHPDKHGSTPEDTRRATIVFTRINTAYETLSDSYKRMVYDAELRSKILTSKSSSNAAAAEANGIGFDKWFSRERQREMERARERETALREVMIVKEAQEKLRQERLRLLQAKERQKKLEAEEAELKQQNSVLERQRTSARAPPPNVSTVKSSTTSNQVPPPVPPPTSPQHKSTMKDTSPALSDSSVENHPPNDDDQPTMYSTTRNEYKSNSLYESKLKSNESSPLPKYKLNSELKNDSRKTDARDSTLPKSTVYQEKNHSSSSQPSTSNPTRTSQSPQSQSSSRQSAVDAAQSIGSTSPRMSGEFYNSSTDIPLYQSTTSPTNQHDASELNRVMRQLIDALSGYGLSVDEMSEEDLHEVSQTAAAVLTQEKRRGKLSPSSQPDIQTLLSAALKESRTQLRNLGIRVGDEDINDFVDNDSEDSDEMEVIDEIHTNDASETYHTKTSYAKPRATFASDEFIQPNHHASDIPAEYTTRKSHMFTDVHQSSPHRYGEHNDDSMMWSAVDDSDTLEYHDEDEEDEEDASDLSSNPEVDIALSELSRELQRSFTDLPTFEKVLSGESTA